MIIDVHYHFYPADHRIENLMKWIVAAAEKLKRNIDTDAISRKLKESVSDTTGEHLISNMDKAGIGLCLINASDNSDLAGNTEAYRQQHNRLLGALAHKYPDRLVALAGIDPRRPKAADMLKQCFEEFGVGGLKYHPDNGYDPSGNESYKVLEVLAENKGILLTHTGPMPPPARNRFVDAMLLSDVAVDFPEIKVIGAHMGYAVNWRPWASIAARIPNLYGDLAAHQPFAFSNYEQFCLELRHILDYAGVGKVLFGTDDPIYNAIIPTKDWISLLKDLPSKSPEGVRFTKEEIDAILGGNALALLDLPQDLASED